MQKFKFWNFARNLHLAHLLKLHDNMYKYEMDPTRTLGITERTRDAGRTEGYTDGQIDRQTGGQMEWNQYTPQQLCCVGGITRQIDADIWSHPSHYLVDPYTLPWSPKCHSHGHEWLTHIPLVHCQSALLSFLRYGYFQIWPWKSMVKSMHLVKSQDYIVGSVTNRFTSSVLRYHHHHMITHTSDSHQIPSQNKTKSKLQILKNCQKFKFCKKYYTWHTFWSFLIRCKKWNGSNQNCTRYRADTGCGTGGQTDGRNETNIPLNNFIVWGV